MLFLTALDMIFARPAGTRAPPREQEEASYGQDVSVFLLATPLIADPGAITTVLLHTGGRSIPEMAVVVGVLLVVLGLVLASPLLAARVVRLRVVRLFGETCSKVLSRVLAVRFVLDGIRAGFSLGQPLARGRPLILPLWRTVR